MCLLVFTGVYCSDVLISFPFTCKQCWKSCESRLYTITGRYNYYGIIIEPFIEPIATRLIYFISNRILLRVSKVNRLDRGYMYLSFFFGCSQSCIIKCRSHDWFVIFLRTNCSHSISSELSWPSKTLCKRRKWISYTDAMNQIIINDFYILAKWASVGAVGCHLRKLVSALDTKFLTTTERWACHQSYSLCALRLVSTNKKTKI